MTPSTAKKAAQCIVVPFADGLRFRVGGRTAVYDVYPEMISGELCCSCPSLKPRCSHIHAVEHHQKQKEKLQHAS